MFFPKNNEKLSLINSMSQQGSYVVMGREGLSQKDSSDGGHSVCYNGKIRKPLNCP